MIRYGEMPLTIDGIIFRIYIYIRKTKYLYLIYDLVNIFVL